MPRTRGGQAMPAGTDVAQPQVVTPTAGQTVAVDAASTILILRPAGLLATLTVTLPALPSTGAKQVTICSTQAVTLLTLNAAGGATVVGAIAALALGGFATYVFDNNTWIRCG